MLINQKLIHVSGRLLRPCEWLKTAFVQLFLNCRFFPIFDVRLTLLSKDLFTPLMTILIIFSALCCVINIVHTGLKWLGTHSRSLIRLSCWNNGFCAVFTHLFFKFLIRNLIMWNFIKSANIINSKK